MNLNGINVQVSPFIQPVQKVKLSHDFTACSETFKYQMNNWLLDMFGTYMPTYMLGNTLVMSPKHYAMLRGEKGVE